MHHQNLVVKLAHFEGHIVLDPAGPFATRIQLCPRNVISGFDFEEFGEWLCEPCAADDEVLVALIDSELPSRNSSTSNDAKAARWNSDELSVRGMRECAVVSDSRQVRASGNFLRMLFFFDVK